MSETKETISIKPALPSIGRCPTLLVAQNRHEVFINFECAELLDIHVAFSPTQVDVKTTKFEFGLRPFEDIVPEECTYRMCGFIFNIILRKRTKGFWKSILDPSGGYKGHLKADWKLWKDDKSEDEEEEEEEEGSLPDLSGMGPTGEGDISDGSEDEEDKDAQDAQEEKKAVPCDSPVIEEPESKKKEDPLPSKDESNKDTPVMLV